MTDDKLDRILRHDARESLPGGDFTARVMAALPERAPRPYRWLTPVLVLGSAALGSVLAALFAPAGINVMQGFVDLAQMRGFTPALITGLAMSAALLVSAIVLATDID
jgi:hypothetical protein